jgi:phosphoribosylanthranilate isomerase
MFRIKICGITRVEDAVMAAQAGADAIGLNFYPKSPRFLDAATARQIVAALPGGIAKVGLFVNAAAADICRTFDELGLDLIQLHGDEPPELLAELGPRPVMRAFRLQSGLDEAVNYLDQCRRLNCLPRMALIDAYVAGMYGGTGGRCDWEMIRGYLALAGYPPLVLAGGLTADNVAEAIHTVRPAAVDTASGVESSPGRKDPAAVAAFVRTACEAFASLP